MKEAWDQHRKELEKVKNEFFFLVPVEIIVPADVEDEQVVSQFEISLLDICAARNNNAQLTQETKANKRGFYDEIRERLDKKIADRVEWKSNEWESDDTKPIKVRDLIALSWIPLNFASENGLLPSDVFVAPQNIYRNKGECSKQFDKLMERPKISEARDGPRHELLSKTVGSAFDILADLPELYDKIYADFPDAYNNNGFRFGGNSIVKIYDPAKRNAANDKSGYVISQPFTPFTEKTVSYRYPEGLMMPLVYGLKGLLKVEDESVVWATDPFRFLNNYLKNIASAYRLVLDMAQFDPQKLSKNQASHEFAVSEFEKALMKHEAQR